MDFSRRDFSKFIAGAGAAAALGQLARTSAIAAGGTGYRAMVGVFLFGGNDGWNMVVPTDSRYAGYAASRGTVALAQARLTTLGGAAFALHPAMAPLNAVWDEGALGLVLNAGTLFAPLTKATYQSRSDLRPTNLLSHSDEQAHWQGLRARTDNFDGFMGRIADRSATPATPALISLGGSNLAVIGQTSAPLILPSTGTLSRTGYTTGSSAKNSAIDAFATAAGMGTIADVTAKQITAAYTQATTANTILTATSGVDAFFVNPTTGATLTSDVSRQLLRVARMIEARGSLGHDRQTFFVTQGGYDNHSAQVNTDTSAGTHANLLGDLALALSAFHRALKSLGVADGVTTFTMSDFGRTYKGNAQAGTDHAWGSNHLVMGAALKARTVHGLYPATTLGGADDVASEGRFLPQIAQEEYLGAIARWHGVTDTDMPYVMPNWSTWTTGGRGPLGLFA
ncbi:DUF1501 domain-containing protein [Sphingomonas donggukensis]|uniref:DUF1501 domain-containing protein n=1 Tax=Sphingomonas donggukensis TaxID=2949093 RepID=A0ABY4TUR3_9SPHN|nr:DUF1501 domain-containing protein [Sphingomonas donggukensis]URW76027.1 DUF1501 domain-containing protein [Sphingomonas donggukensis]